ncbi:MAG: SpaA isopeptide-forming pilin-related protein, partial [Oscillospiraceae bacterium]
LAGGVFSIYAGSSATGTPLYSGLTTNSSGIVVQGNLAAGTYTVLETQAPPGYIKASSPITLTLLLGETKQVKFINTCETTSGITILKVDENNLPLAGGVFSIYAGSSATGTPLYTGLTTNSSGTVTKSGLAAGTYTVLETQAPAGFVKAPNPITITVAVGETKQVKFINTALRNSGIQIFKVNHNAVPLAGGVFSIYAGSSATGTPLYTNLTTGSNGLVLQGNLAAGTYTVLETQAPTGYIKAPNPITVTLAASEVKQITFTNTPAYNSGIQIIKVDEGNLPLAGGVFSIYAGSSATGTPLYTNLTTDSTGKVLQSGLIAGTYTVLETQAPAGYVKANVPQTVVLAVNETSDVKFVNTREASSAIQIIKVDQYNLPVAGAKFSIYAGSTTTGTPLYTNLTTNSSGVVLQGGLAAGTYTVLETEAPAGYQKSPNPITVTVAAKETKNVNFVNTCTKSIMHLFKYDAVTHQQLAGAVFKVYDSAALTHEVAQATSLAGGPAVIDTLSPGTYYVKETAVPSGYLLDPNPKTVTLTSGTVTDVNFYNSKSVPTAGNYGRLLIVGVAMMSLCVLGWVGFILNKKRIETESHEENL